MVRVMATGVFDILHMGHLHFLQEARRLGDELVVVVATDATARARKHEPITSQEMRLELVSALKPVDMAVLGKEGDIFEILEEIKPDIIALGYDQTHDPNKIIEECRRRGIEVKVIRLPKMNHDLDGTRKIIGKVVDWYAAQRRLKEVEGG
ncbi:MAG: adenylyltransferase/cytidyltransferase family protein [Candidatus Thermoplasmatota archaeon]